MGDLTGDGSAFATFALDGNDSVAVWTAAPPSATWQRYEPAPFAGASFFGGPFLRFSPSGRQILLTFYRAGRGFEAWLLPFPADARRPPHRVFENLPIVGDNVDFSWLPDERHVVLAAALGSLDETPERRLYLVDTQSDALRVLPTAFSAPSIPVVSPDGKKIIVGEQRTDYDIVTLDLHTATVERLVATATDRAEILPAWAADTEAMVYATDRSGALEIWLHRPPQPDRPLVTAEHFSTSTLLLFAATLSPDAKRVIFHRVGEADESRLWLAAVDGGQPEPLTNESLTERAGSWSPDREWYVYWASPPEGGRNALKKVRTTGRATPETLLNDLELAPPGHAPIWSPDGEWILVVAADGLTLVSADGSGRSRHLTDETMACAFADSEPLLYCIRGDYAPIPLGEYALVVLDFEGRDVRSSPLPAAYRPVTGISPGLRLSPTPDRRGVTYAIESVSRTLSLVEGLYEMPLP
jgi:dipeptidyl aminopeptidase/acylaminoacyl peptidase